MLARKYSSLTAIDGGGLSHSATWTITHSWQNHGWLIHLSNRREHKTAIYFIINFMLELAFLSFNKSLNPWLRRYSCGNMWRKRERERERNTFNHQCSCAAGWSKVVSGHTRVSAAIWFGNVGDTQSPILHDSLSEENDKTEIAHLFFHQFFNWMKSSDEKKKNQMNTS